MFHNLVYTYFCLLGYVEYRLVIWRAEYINVCSDAPIIKAYRGVETEYRAFLTLNLGRGELSAPQPDRFNPKKEPKWKGETSLPLAANGARPSSSN